MDVPLELSFDNVESTPDLEALIRRRVDRLDRHHPKLTSCRVAVERPHATPSGNPYRVRIHARVPPDHDLVASKEPGQNDPQHDLPTIVRRAFDAVERQLEEIVERQRGEIKAHEQAIGIVVRLEKNDDYGFLKTPEEREIYFHRNSVLHGEFDDLELGTMVRFEATQGEKGPQATTVQVVDKRGARASEDEVEAEASAAEPPRGWRP